MTYVIDATKGTTSPDGSKQNKAAVLENLLVDPTLQVNQAGFAGGTVTAGQYGPDMWFATAAAGNATLNYSGETKTLTGRLSTYLFNTYLQGENVTVGFKNQTGAATVTIDGSSTVINPGEEVTFAIGGAATFPLEFRIEGTGLEFDQVKCVAGDVLGSFDRVYDPDAFYLDRVLSWFERRLFESTSNVFTVAQCTTAQDCVGVITFSKKKTLPSSVSFSGGISVRNSTGSSGAATVQTLTINSVDNADALFRRSAGGLTAGNAAQVRLDQNEHIDIDARPSPL